MSSSAVAWLHVDMLKEWFLQEIPAGEKQPHNTQSTTRADQLTCKWTAENNREHLTVFTFEVYKVYIHPFIHW